MNAAYLMLTTAWLAGQPANPPAGAPAAQPAAPVVSAPMGGGCGGGCGSGCGCQTDSCCEQKPGLCARIKAKFQRNDCCDSCNSCQQQSCCAPAKQSCCPAPAPTCCAPAPTCCQNACEDPCAKQGLFARLKAKFKKNDCCDSGCGSSCGSCGCGGATTTVPSGEALPVKPKEGEGGKPMPKTGSVMHSMPTVTPVVAPRLSSEQPF